MTELWYRGAWVDGAAVAKANIRDGLRDFAAVVVSVTQLRALTTRAAKYFLVTSTIGDMPALYVYDSGDTTSVDDGTGVIVSADGGRYKIAARREVLTANRTYYVRTDGSDSNSGLVNTSAGAFLTLSAAAAACAKLDCSTYNVTISVGSGSFAGVTLPAMLGSGTFTLSGAGIGTIISAVVLAPRSVWTVSEFKLYGSAALLTVSAYAYGTVSSGIEFGAATEQVFVRQNATFFAASNYTISGGATRHWRADESGTIFAYGRTVTLSGAPAYSGSFAYVFHGSTAIVGAMTFSGAATGTRFVVSSNSVINTAGGGASYLPGNASGVTDTATGGVYA